MNKNDNKPNKKRSRYNYTIIVPIWMLMFAIALVIGYINFMDISRERGIEAVKELERQGPWEQGGIWASDDGKYYLVSIDGTRMVYMYAYIDAESAWLKGYFEPYNVSASGKSYFDNSEKRSYALHWKASAEDGTLILKAERNPFEDYMRLPCDRTIKFVKTDKTKEDLPFREDYEELWEKFAR